MQEEVKAIEELNDAEIEQVSGAGVMEDIFRAISGGIGGSTPAKTGVMGGLRG
jgi:hypothetical protein